MLWVWWDRKRVIYYDLLQPGETVITERYWQQMVNLSQALSKSMKVTPSYFISC